MCVRLGAGNAEIPERILEPVVSGYIDEFSVFFQWNVEVCVVYFLSTMY